MRTKKEIQADIDAAAALTKKYLDELYIFERIAENNVFDGLETAEEEIQEILENRAREDCEGSYNCGAPEYRQEFMVDSVKYVGILSVEYNRHDKTYYYVEESDFKVKKL